MVGIGVDIVEIDRIEAALNKGDRFLMKIFTEKERQVFSIKNNRPETIAGVFAAKEAVSKVLGTGVSGFAWQDIEIFYTDSGQPKVALHGQAGQRAKNMNITDILISISHCKTYAVANAAGI